MSEYFGNYKRPKEEMELIQKFIQIFTQSKKEYKLKNLKKALSGFLSGFELLLDIFDIYPKTVTLNFIIKCQFQLQKYNDCYDSISKIKQYLPDLIKNKKEVFIKLKSKIFFYEFILDFICENLDKSILNVTEFISYLKNAIIFTLEEKVNFFWIFIKNFIKLGENKKSRNFLFFKEQYNSMIVEENISKKKYEKFYMKKQKKVSREFLIFYKTFMNSKLKEIIYENLDKKYYFYKFGEVDENLINFLYRNMEFYMQSGNKDMLIEKVENYLLINKIDLNKKFHWSINQLIYEQKMRITCFTTAFLNIVGAFNQIFKEHLSENIFKLKPLKNSKSTTLIFGRKEIKEMEEKLIKKMKIMDTGINATSKETNNKFISLSDFNLEFKVPPLGKKNKQTESSKLYFSNEKYKNLFNCSYKISGAHNFSTTKINIENQNSLPILKVNNNLKKTLHLKRENKNKIFDLLNKIFYQKIIYKRINYFAISKFREIYEYKIEEINMNKKEIDENNSKKKNFNIKDNLVNLKIYNSVKEINFYKISGELTSKNYNNNCLIFENFILIKNFYLLGLCESQGKFNVQISKAISVLYPTFLNYLIIEFILAKENKDLGEIIIQLLKLEELSSEIKDINLLSYINDKLKINYKYFLSFSLDVNKLSSIIYEALFYIVKEIIQKNKYQFHSSGFNLCSLMIIGKILIILNIGNPKFLIGSKIQIQNSDKNNNDESNYNKWEYKQFSFNKKNKNNKKMTLINNNINLKEEDNKNIKDNKDIKYSFKLTEKESIIFGKMENNYNKKGIIFEQEVVKYELNSDDKIIIFGSEGFWNYINNEEAINFIGKYYDDGLNSEEISKLIVEMAQNKMIESNKKNPRNIYRKEPEKEIDEGLDFDDITCMIIYLDIK